MLTITKLKMWKNPGYTRGCVEIPPVSSKRLPSPDFTSGTGVTYRPRKNSTLTALELPLNYTQLFDMSYLYIEASDGAGSVSLFGWIESIEQTASSESAVLIRWSVDWWRSYSGNVTFGFGIVKRRPRGDNDPIQKVPYRYKMPGESLNVVPNGIVGSESNWCIVTYVEKTSVDIGTGGNHQYVEKETGIKTCAFPVSKDNPTELKYVYNEGAVQSPSIKDVILGNVSSTLGISPSSIVSAFISPIPPYLLKEGTGTSVDPYKVDNTPVLRPVTHVINYPRPYITGIYEDSDGVWTYYNYSDGTSGIASLQPKYTQGGDTCSGHNAELIFKYNGQRVDSMMWLNPTTASLYYLSLNGYPGNTHKVGDTLVLTNVYTVPRENTDSGRPFQTLSGQPHTNYEVSLSGGTFRSTLTLTYDGVRWVNPYDADPTQPGLLVKVNDHLGIANYTTTELYDASEIEVTAQGTMSSKTQQFVEYSGAVNITTTDTQEWVVTDMTGHVVGSVPWGIPLTDYTIRTVVSSTSAYIQIRARGLDSSVMGMEYTIPLQPIDITTNSWSDYVYSGQREYDTEQRKIAKDRAFEDSMMNVMGNTVSNTIFGALSGKGAVAGISGVSTAVSGIVSANMERDRTSYWNDRLQEQDDMIHAKQIDNIMIPGGSWDWLWHGRELKFVPISPDPYSVSQFTNHISSEGITVSEPTSDCSSLIASGGALQIESMSITGIAPPQAKQNIKILLENGVRIIEMNPDGVTP